MEANQLIEKNQDLADAVTDLQQETLEEKVLKKLKEISEILTRIDAQSIDLSVFIEQIQSFSDEKKAELQELINKIDNPLGVLTKTFSTIDPNVILPDGYIYQEVYEKDGVITKYGAVFIAGFNNGFNGGTSFQGAGFIRQPLPDDVEFDYIGGSTAMLYARPKAGQRDVGGIVGSLDNVLYMWGGGQFGTAGNGTTWNYYIPIAHTFNARVKKIQAGVITRIYNGCSQNTLALLENGEIWGCGSNWGAALGLGNTTQTNTWTKISSLSGVKDIYMMRSVVFATTNSNIYGWGENVRGSGAVGRSGVITAPSVVKTISENSKVEFCSMGCYTGDSAEYVNTAICIDGKLFGAGFNGYGEIDNSGVEKNSLVEISSPQGNQWTLEDGDTFFIHPVLSLVLKKNTNGGTDLYSAGYGSFGYGNSDAAGSNQKKGFKLVKSFNGTGWEIMYQRQYTDNVGWFYTIFIVNKKKREIYAFGKNDRGGLGIGNNDDSKSRSLQKVILPNAVKTAKRFEVRPQYYNGSGSITLIVDDKFYACGTINNSFMLTKGTNYILQIQQ